MRPEGREPLADKAGESTLPSRSGEEKGLRGGGAGKPQGSSRGRPGFRGTLWVPGGLFRTMHGRVTAPSCWLHSQGGVRRGVRASGSYQEGTAKSGCFAMWKHPRGHVWNVVVSPASS